MAVTRAMYVQLMLCAGLAAGATAIQAQTVTLNQDAVPACGNLNVRYEGFPPTSSAKGNWLAIAPVDSAANFQTYRFVYLPAQSQGRHTFSTRGLIPFMPYEVRGYLDWEGTHSWEIVARAEFIVLPNQACKPPMITRADGTVFSGDKLTFAFQHMKKTASNWATLAMPSQKDWQFVKSTYLPAVSTGEAALDTTGMAPGVYELRLYEDWAGTKEYFVYSRVEVTIK